MKGEWKPRKFGADPGRYFEGTLSALVPTTYVPREERTVEWKIYAGAVRRGDFEVAVLYYLESWNDFPFMKESVQSLRVVDDKEMVARRAEVEAKAKKAGGGDEAWFARIKARVPPGWKYFRRNEMVYIHDDGVTVASVENMAARLETMRKKVYAPMYPPVEAPEASGAVVKVTRDRRQYLSYGAPDNTLGYWSAGLRELVLFVQPDSPYSFDRIDAQGTLYHEGFHQYMHHALGGVSAHPWFEEGHGDYFSGWTVKDGVARKGTSDLRTEDVDRFLRNGSWIPMGRFLAMEWDAFYGKGADAVGNTGAAYAQAWSLVTFLRDGPRAKLLDGYYKSLRDAVMEWRREEQIAATKESRPPRPAQEMQEKEARAVRQRALRRALEGVDLVALEQAWLDWATR